MKLLSFLLVLGIFAVSCTRTPTYDIVVYGGTSAGVTAAVQAARMGKSVVLVAQGTHLGGMTSNGLGQTDSGKQSVIGGLSREFYQRIKSYYDIEAAWIQEDSGEFTWYEADRDAMWRFEPHVAEAVFEQMLQEEDIPVLRNERLDRQNGVENHETAIRAIRMQSGREFRAAMFIDATYEGDLMAAAGVTYTVGREANSTYNETLNGVQKQYAIHHQFYDGVDPYVVPGDPSSGLLPGVHGNDPGDDGQADSRVQAYCFRLCLTDVPENQVPFSKPETYDSLRYELLLRNFAAGETKVPWYIGMMPNRKTDLNNNTGFSTDNIGKNYNYPEASYAERQRIIAEHRTYQQGFLWTLANHRRVPEPIRAEVSRWGLAKDEFVDNDHWPYELYIREARRMVGEYVVTEHDCRRDTLCSDPVGLGSYNMDSHNCQRYVTPEGFVKNEGDVQVSPGGAYLISYRALVPKRDEVQNLLVPVCLSASHIAYGSIRMEPVFMILGQSAATAAALAIDNRSAVQDVDYDELQRRLVRDDQIVELPAEDVPANPVYK